MSEFHRMITYLYLYEQEFKSRNIGFAKIEKRDQRCLLEIHMKNTGCSMSPVPVYFYLQKGGHLAGIPLGNFTLSRGSGDFKTVLDAENLNDTGYPLDDVKGIYIPLTQQIMLVSQWDDDEFRRDAFVELANLTETEAQTPDAPSGSEPSTEDALSVPERQISSPSVLLNTVETAQASLPRNTTDALKALEALPRPADRTASFKTVSSTDRKTKNTAIDTPEDWNLRWRFILENYPVMTPFAGDEKTLCVRMELKDLRQLPRQFWYLGNNSFLLHGFFNYRYLILGMTEEDGNKKWFMGIPGVFQNPERVMAALFGFPKFRSEKSSPIKTGEFGYWYRYLNELDASFADDTP